MSLIPQRMLGKLGLGSGASEPPAPRTAPRIRKPAVRASKAADQHPWRELILRDDKLFHAPPRKEEIEYLSTPAVEITGKKEVIAAADGARASYAFQLNTAPDLFWRQRFSKNLQVMPKGIHRADLRAEFQDDTLLLLCMPSRLEAKYAFVKSTIARTNADYEAEKRRVRERVAGGNGKPDRQSAATARVQKIRDRWDRLEL